MSVLLFRRLLLLIGLLLSAIVIFAQEGDISVGESINGNLSSQTSFDIYLESGQQVDISLSSEDFNTRLEIFNSAGESLATATGTATSRNSALSFTASETGLYTIAVSSSRRQTSGAFVLSITGGITRLFEDDFSSNDADWETLTNSDAIFSGFEDGAYVINFLGSNNNGSWLVGPGFTDWSKAPIFSGNYDYEFTVSNIETMGLLGFCISVIFDLQENYSSYKAMHLCADAWYYTDGGEIISRGEYGTLYLHRTPLRIRLRVTDNLYLAYINDQQYAQVSNVAPTNGSIGFGLISHDILRYDARRYMTIRATFDDLLVCENSCDAPAPVVTTVSTNYPPFDPDEEKTIMGVLLDEGVDTSYGFAFWYPGASNWRPTESSEGSLYSGYTMALDGLDQGLPIVEVYPSGASTENLADVALEKVRDYSEETLGGFSLLGAAVTVESYDIDGETIGFAGASTSTAAVFAFVKRLDNGQLAVFRYISYPEWYEEALESGDFELIFLMAASAENVAVTNERILSFETQAIASGETVTGTITASMLEVRWYFSANPLTELSLSISSPDIDSIRIDIVGQATETGSFFLPVDMMRRPPFAYGETEQEIILTRYQLPAAISNRYAVQLSTSSNSELEYTLTIDLGTGTISNPSTASITATPSNTSTVSITAMPSNMPSSTHTPTTSAATSSTASPSVTPALVHCEGAPVSRLYPGDRGRVTATQATSNRVRSAPSRSGETLGYLDALEEFDVLEGPVCAEGYAWYRVQSGQLEGWTAEGVEGDYWLEPLGTANATAIPEDSCVVIADGLTNMRTGPGTSYSLAGQLADGDSVLVTGKQYSTEGFLWWQLANGAWVRSDVVEIEGDCSAIPDLGEESSQAQTDELHIGGQARVYVEDDGLSLRTGSGIDFGLIEKLPSGTVVEILDGPVSADGYVWWRVRAPSGAEGWVVEGADGIVTLIPLP